MDGASLQDFWIWPNGSCAQDYIMLSDLINGCFSYEMYILLDSIGIRFIVCIFEMLVHCVDFFCILSVLQANQMMKSNCLQIRVSPQWFHTFLCKKRPNRALKIKCFNWLPVDAHEVRFVLLHFFSASTLNRRIGTYDYVSSAILLIQEISDINMIVFQL